MEIWDVEKHWSMHNYSGVEVLKGAFSKFAVSD